MISQSHPIREGLHPLRIDEVKIMSCCTMITNKGFKEPLLDGPVRDVYEDKLSTGLEYARKFR